MPASNATDRAVKNDESDPLSRRLLELTPEQKRILAEKVFALLRQELRVERERNPVRHRLE